jgi:arylsulfatase A-like enzyme
MHVKGWKGFGLLVLAQAVFVFLIDANAAQPKRPNIVIIMADDMGFSDIGCYGGEIATPHIDSLAASGIRFTQFYNNGRCCPTRASLLTGLYSHQAGVGHMIQDRGTPAYQGRLNDRCVTIAEVLRDAGYTTSMSGKWHVGDAKAAWPTARGFDRYFGIISGAGSYFETGTRKMLFQDQPWSTNNYYLTDTFTDFALQFLDESHRTNKPFFLYLAFTAPHWPLQAPAEEIAKYRGKYSAGWDALRTARHNRMLADGIVDKRWPVSPRDSSAAQWEDLSDGERADRELRMAVYAAQIDRMDQNIGRVLTKLKELGAEENTLVMFLADNGGCAEVINNSKPGAAPGSRESFVSYGLPWANVSNTPFRMFKHWVHEGGIATPLVVRWPTVIKRGGKLTAQPGHVIDLMATCLDVAGTAYPTNFYGREITPLEGKSLRTIVEGKKRKEHDALFWEHEGNRAVRQGKWKLVAKNNQPWELYDLEADRTEMHDLASANRKKVHEMEAIYSAWADKCGVLPWKEVRRAARQ